MIFSAFDVKVYVHTDSLPPRPQYKSKICQPNNNTNTLKTDPGGLGFGSPFGYTQGFEGQHFPGTPFIDWIFVPSPMSLMH